MCSNIRCDGYCRFFLENKQGLNIKKICNFYICDQLRRSLYSIGKQHLNQSCKVSEVGWLKDNPTELDAMGHCCEWLGRSYLRSIIPFSSTVSFGILESPTAYLSFLVVQRNRNY